MSRMMGTYYTQHIVGNTINCKEKNTNCPVAYILDKARYIDDLLCPKVRKARG